MAAAPSAPAAAAPAAAAPAAAAPAAPPVPAAPAPPALAPPAAAAALAPAAPALVYAYDGDSAVPVPELDFPAGLAACGVSDAYAAALYAAGGMLGAAGGGYAPRQQGSYWRRRRPPQLAPVRLPGAAGEVSCSREFSLALQRGGGAVWSWGPDLDALGRRGAAQPPATVSGLPADDPVVGIAAGDTCSLARTASGEVYGWGPTVSAYYGIAAHTVPGLSDGSARRVACAGNLLTAEARRGAGAGGGALRYIPSFDHSGPAAPVPLLTPAVRWPLRALAALGRFTGVECLAAVDAEGTVWLWAETDCHKDPPARAALPPGERAVHLALSRYSLVALTERGALWDFTDPTTCRPVSPAAAPPLRFVPYGGSAATRVLLVRDLCGGRRRLELFARITARIGVPSDLVREVVTPLMVHGVYLTGPPHDPFSRLCLAAAGDEEEEEEEWGEEEWKKEEEEEDP